jgi:hypothetical protein
MDPFVVLSAAAAVTKTLKLATGVCLVVQRDPIQTAKLVASIDQVSGGRFLFGVGGAWNAEEIEDHGTAFKTRFKLMRERIEAMKEIWTKDKAEYQRRVRQLPDDDDLAKAGPEAVPADYRWRCLSPCRAAGHSLRRRVGADCRSSSLRRCPRILTKVQADGDGSRSQPWSRDRQPGRTTRLC